MRQRLDQLLVTKHLCTSRSQAENWIKLGHVLVNSQVVSKPGQFFDVSVSISLATTEQYVSRAGLKLASVAQILKLNFTDKIVLDVGSSTGGFTDYALQHGAQHVYAVDVGTDQLHASLRTHPRISLFEKTDIRQFKPPESPDIIVIDVSFISLRDILPYVRTITTHKTQIIAMVKPQFEAGREQVSKGVIKNDRIRRNILKSFEQWAKQYFVIIDKADSEVAGAAGNRERFYYLELTNP